MIKAAIKMAITAKGQPNTIPPKIKNLRLRGTRKNSLYATNAIRTPIIK